MKNEEMARLFSEATPYIQKYHGKTMVVKYGGNAMINEELKNAVMNDLVTLTLLGVRVVLVHGGGPAINEMLKKVGVESHFANGLRVTDDATMEIVFNVLETEIAHLKAGMEVEITPYANDKVTLKGTVTEVNPKIDENGMVKVRATTDNPEAVLVDGMNVSILAKRQIADKLIVPKTAVLPRQGRKVVFVYENGRAIWKYVETGFENSREVCIESGLKEGEEAIYENNLGLSHECEVTLINKKE